MIIRQFKHVNVCVQVQSAIGRMNVKSEAGVAASLALVRLSVQALGQDTLRDITEVGGGCGGVPG